MENISFAWTGDLELLKQFVNEILNLDGEWSQPGSDRKVFTYGDSSITWRKNKCLLSFTGERSDEIKQEVCKQICVNNLTKATQSVFDESNKSSQACTEAIESLKADQKLNNEVIQSLAESISRISTVVCELQTRLENSDFNTPYLKSQSKESGNAKQSSEDSCIVMTELCKSPEHDPRASEIKENELNSNNCGEIENKSIASETHLNNQSMEINNQNQITYAEAVKSHCQSENKQIQAENNQIKGAELSNSLSSDGFIGVERKRKRNKSFFLSGIDENVKECQIYSYMTERNVVPIKISMFQSKRKGTASAKILVPSNCSSQILSTHFWPRFIHCKLWQRKEIRDRTCNEQKLTQSGTHSTYV